MELFIAVAALVISILGHVGVLCFGWGRLKGALSGLKDEFITIRDNHSHQINKLESAEVELSKQVAVLVERVDNVLDRM